MPPRRHKDQSVDQCYFEFLEENVEKEKQNGKEGNVLQINNYKMKYMLKEYRPKTLESM